MNIESIVDACFAFPGAVLIRRDAGNFRNVENVAYEIGIQQPRQHKRFANVFRAGESGAVYFKHDPDEIADLSARYPAAIKPSEISPKHWSRALFEKGLPAESYELLVATSYRLVLESCTKKGRATIESIAEEESRFATFHAFAIDAERSSDRIYAHYTDDAHGGPCITVDGKNLVRYEFNSIVFDVDRRCLGDLPFEETPDGAVLSPRCSVEDWKTAMQRAVDAALAE